MMLFMFFHAGCEYGDVSSSCSKLFNGSADCGRPDFASSCCKTCQVYKKQISCIIFVCLISSWQKTEPKQCKSGQHPPSPAKLVIRQTGNIVEVRIAQPTMKEKLCWSTSCCIAKKRHTCLSMFIYRMRRQCRLVSDYLRRVVLRRIRSVDVLCNMRSTKNYQSMYVKVCQVLRNLVS